MIESLRKLIAVEGEFAKVIWQLQLKFAPLIIKQNLQYRQIESLIIHLLAKDRLKEIDFQKIFLEFCKTDLALEQKNSESIDLILAIYHQSIALMTDLKISQDVMSVIYDYSVAIMGQLVFPDFPELFEKSSAFSRYFNLDELLTALDQLPPPPYIESNESQALDDELPPLESFSPPPYVTETDNEVQDIDDDELPPLESFPPLPPPPLPPQQLAELTEELASSGSKPRLKSAVNCPDDGQDEQDIARAEGSSGESSKAMSAPSRSDLFAEIHQARKPSELRKLTPAQCRQRAIESKSEFPWPFSLPATSGPGGRSFRDRIADLRASQQGHQSDEEQPDEDWSSDEEVDENKRPGCG